MLHLNKDDIIIGDMGGYCPRNILIEDTHELNILADEQQKANGQCVCFTFDENYDNYSDEDWYNFYFTCDANGVTGMYYEYGISCDYCGKIEIDDETKKNAWEVILEYYGGLEEYQKAVRNYDGDEEKTTKAMTKREENIIEIAWVHQQICATHGYLNTDFDSKEAKQKIVELADAFEKKYPDTDWNASEIPYYEAIEIFAAEGLREWNRTEVYTPHTP